MLRHLRETGGALRHLDPVSGSSAYHFCQNRACVLMKIIIVGCGKVGTALARQLSAEGHDITVIDASAARVDRVTQDLDVMGVVGNGASVSVLGEVGVQSADVFIAVTGSDELNLLCCMFAKKAAHCSVIARVRNPTYIHEVDFLKQQVGISTRSLPPHGRSPV